jgi:hypothetical protein
MVLQWQYGSVRIETRCVDGHLLAVRPAAWSGPDVTRTHISC